MTDHRHRDEATVAVLAVITALAVAVPRPAAAWTVLAEGSSAGEPTAPVLAVLALAAWTLTGWLLLGASVAAAGHLPGLVGRCAAAVAARTVPRAVRRAVDLALGAGLVLGSTGALPASAATTDTGPAGGTGPPAAVLVLDWPTPGAAPAPTAPATAALAAPTSGTTPAAQPPAATTSTGREPATRAPTTTGRASTGTQPATVTVPATRTTTPAPQRATVTVRPGDTLWALAERSLRSPGAGAPSDAAVAAAWPAWWAANREAIGDDPHLLRPGTALVPPQQP